MFNFGPDMIFRIPALLIALTVHEYAHARTAVSFGDPTPRIAGRLTLNPLAHLDPFGLIMLWLVNFGWAKPVPINPHNLRNGRTGIILVSFAGAGANILTALAGALIEIVLMKMNLLNLEIERICYWLIMYNAILAVFNLIPLPPLDGSQILSALLPEKQADSFQRISTYGPFILMALVVTGVIGYIISPFIQILIGIIGFIAGLII